MRHPLLPAILGLLGWFALSPVVPRVMADPAPASERIVLERGAWLLRPGFTPADAAGFRDDASARRITVFPVSPNALFPVAVGSGLRHFAAQTVFHLPADRLAPSRLLGLQLASIGENWEIFVNGHRIATEMHLDDTGAITSHRSLRDLLVPLPHAFLQAGDNTLVIHLAGNAPATAWTDNTAFGFYKATGYVVDDFDILFRQRVEVMTPLMLAVLFVFGFYAAVSYYYRPQERHHLYFGLLSAALFFYYAARSHFIFDMIADTEITTRLEYASIMLLAPVLVNFLEYFFFPERSATLRRLKVYTGVSAGFTLLMGVLPFGYTDDLLRLWQISAVAVAVLILWIIRAAVRRRREYANELLLSTVFLCVATMFDVIDSAFFSFGFLFNQYAFLLFIASLAWVSAKRTMAMRIQTEALNRSLLEQENRLHSLFDAAFEAIVIHDGGRIVDCNPAFLSLFGVSVEEAMGKPLAAVIDSEPAFEPVAASGVAAVQEAIARSQSTTPFHIQYVSKRHPYKDRILDMTAIRDIHARKLSEEKLRERNAELELMINAMAGREQRMNELQLEVDKLTPTR